MVSKEGPLEPRSFMRTFQFSGNGQLGDTRPDAGDGSRPDVAYQQGRLAHQGQFCGVLDGPEPLDLSGGRNPAYAGAREGLQGIFLGDG